MKINLPFVFGCFLMFSCIGYGQITVDDTSYTVQQLVDDILIDSNCANTSNWSKKSGEIANINGIGYFNANGSNFPFNEGIVLSTGSAKSTPGPNDSILQEGVETAWGGDADLAAITNTNSLGNASYIEFDFVPLANFVSFNFLFASEEYFQDFPCQFSDVFAFILTDEDGVKTNLAVIPNTNIPIKVTNIHPKITEGNENCEAKNETYFNGYNPINSATNFNGQTVVFNANAEVIPNKSYHIKLVIADFRDKAWDSAVFLEAGSFKSGVSLGEDRTLSSGEPICSDYALNAETFGAISYKWFKDNIEIIGNNTADYLVTETGEYRVEVDMGSSCVFTDVVEIDYFVEPNPIPNPPTLLACEIDGDKKEIFNLSIYETLMLGGFDPNVYKFTYYLTENDANLQSNTLTNITQYESGNKTIYVRFGASKDCFTTTSFNIEVVDPGLIKSLDSQNELCVNANGTALAPIVLDIEMDPSIYSFQWFTGLGTETGQEILSETNPTITISNAGDYSISITHIIYGCVYSSETTVIAIEPPTNIELTIISKLFSEANTVQVSADSGSELVYSIDNEPFQEDAIFYNIAAGEHVFAVKDIYGCNTIEDSIVLVDYPKFFSPNGDNIHETWSIDGGEALDNYALFIFDRYGKLIKQLSKADNGTWDGAFNGSPLVEDDYWFRIQYLYNGKWENFHGHFALKR